MRVHMWVSAIKSSHGSRVKNIKKLINRTALDRRGRVGAGDATDGTGRDGKTPFRFAFSRNPDVMGRTPWPVRGHAVNDDAVGIDVLFALPSPLPATIWAVAVTRSTAVYTAVYSTGSRGPRRYIRPCSGAAADNEFFRLVRGGCQKSGSHENRITAFFPTDLAPDAGGRRFLRRRRLRDGRPLMYNMCRYTVPRCSPLEADN